MIVGFNAGLIALGVGGIIPPTTSALLHNTSTIAISLRSMGNLLEDSEKTIQKQFKKNDTEEQSY